MIIAGIQEVDEDSVVQVQTTVRVELPRRCIAPMEKNVGLGEESRAERRPFKRWRFALRREKSMQTKEVSHAMQR